MSYATKRPRNSIIGELGYMPTIPLDVMSFIKDLRWLNDRDCWY